MSILKWTLNFSIGFCIVETPFLDNIPDVFWTSDTQLVTYIWIYTKIHKTTIWVSSLPHYVMPLVIFRSIWRQDITLLCHTYLYLKFVHVSDAWIGDKCVYAWWENVTKMWWSIMTFSNILIICLMKTKHENMLGILFIY